MVKHDFAWARFFFTLLFVNYCVLVSATGYHLAKTGSDQNSGTFELPFLTIQAAANMAQAGDIIIVHEGVCRERIKPPRGGESNKKRIVYQAAENDGRSPQINY